MNQNLLTISNQNLPSKDEFTEAYKINQEMIKRFSEIMNDEKLDNLIAEVKEFTENGNNIFDAKSLTSKTDFLLNDYLNLIKKGKSQMDLIKKSYLEVEKTFSLFKVEIKKAIDNKRFELQKAKEQELKEAAIKTIQVEEAGMIKQVEVVDNSALAEVEKTKKMIGFKKERIKNEQIIINGARALATAQSAIKNEFVTVVLRENEIRNYIKMAFEEDILDETIKNFDSLGIKIEVIN